MKNQPPSMPPKLTPEEKIPRVIAAGVLIAIAAPKLLGTPMAIRLFASVGVEPWGRLSLGWIELAIALLLLTPSGSLKFLANLFATLWCKIATCPER